MTPDAAQQFEYMALDDFEELLLDKPRDEKWELIGGRVIRGMVGARWEHKRIIQNLTVALMNDFRRRGSNCRPYDETFWLKEKLLDLKVFPDVMVRCGPLEPNAADLCDPVVIIEVLSDGTQKRDRHEKWALYQQLPSLRHYVLIERKQPYVDVFNRGAGEWAAYTPLKGLDAVLKLDAVGFEMTLAEVYRDVLAA